MKRSEQSRDRKGATADSERKNRSLTVAVLLDERAPATLNRL